MIAASLLVALALGQSAPFVRNRVEVGNPEAQCLFWTVPVIEWQLSSVGNPNTPTEDQKQREFEAIRRSFQSWQQLFETCGNLRFSEGPLVDDRKVGYELKGDDNRNLVLFRSETCAARGVSSDNKCWEEQTCGNDFDCWDGEPQTIALTLTTYDVKSGIVYDSDIQLNASGFVFTTADGPTICPRPIGSNPGNCVATDVQNTMTHEIGHLIGLDHTWALGSVMNPSAPQGEVSKRIIDEGSADFVCQTYPMGQASQSCVTPSLERSGNTAVLGQQAFGCSSTGAGAWWPAVAGGLLLAWRRRRGGARP